MNFDEDDMLSYNLDKYSLLEAPVIHSKCELIRVMKESKATRWITCIFKKENNVPDYVKSGS
jgi:hypothetical protein